MRICCIYGLVDPTTHLVFYVGKSVRGLLRAGVHARPRNRENADTRAKLEAISYAFEIVMLEVCTSDQLNTAERWWIAYGRASGWPLTNRTAGGEGLRQVHESTRQLLREAHQRLTPEQRRDRAQRAGRAAQAGLTLGQRREASKVAHATRTPESRRAGAHALVALTTEQRRENYRKGYLALPREQRSAIARQNIMRQSPEERRALARRAGLASAAARKARGSL